MDLFSQFNDFPQNLLPKDGTVNYYGIVLSRLKADTYYNTLLNSIEWKNDEAIIFGKQIFTKRKVAWYAESSFDYSYSNSTKRALLFTNELLELKELVEKQTNETYNSCLLNLYHDGSEGMAWHSDGERDLKEQGAIASLSLGAERKFGFKHKETKETVYKVLEHGSLLVMKDETQKHWLHRLPPTKKIHRPRINLTFRTIEK
ncbi:alpha-ketoglutarate-dependent dioxygenase AlkB family protein [Tenacibaculum retecalamus]|uniref:alpha-ketoglutarate-dependent dioxygenase AlkB family protein n=1 Tax=Tenacibaculum retecalamus TaxID=3018315 RepID=UPI0023D9689F|nr:alpha-ketoglutarate-dependent dioxygenase AlkB [Tenacibaculum retecalamus]WBX70123.1 alpha-ketoglutarate-dependent dioxygenase AlkB [Tenacibaculum retecalamus]